MCLPLCYGVLHLVEGGCGVYIDLLCGYAWACVCVFFLSIFSLWCVGAGDVHSMDGFDSKNESPIPYKLYTTSQYGLYILTYYTDQVPNPIPYQANNYTA